LEETYPLQAYGSFTKDGSFLLVCDLAGRGGPLEDLVFEHDAFGIISVTTGLTELVTDAVVGCL
jgi:hypothetical protein